MAVTLDPVEQIRREIEELADRTDLSPGERVVKLNMLADDLNLIQGRARAYAADIDLLREAEHAGQAEMWMELRENAAIREQLIERGIATPEELDAAGLFALDRLAEMEEEGTLSEAYDWIERLHPRGRGGKWIEKLGSVSLGGRGGRGFKGDLAPKRPKAAKAPKRPRAPEAPPAPEAPEAPEAPKPERRELVAKPPKPERVVARKPTKMVPTGKPDEEFTPTLGPKDLRLPDPPTQEQVQEALNKARSIGLNDWPPRKGRVSRRMFPSDDPADPQDTEQQFSMLNPDTGDPVYAPEREAIHDRIIDMLLRQRKEFTHPDGETEMIPDPEGEYLEPPDDVPRSLWLAGGTASGKTTALKQNPDVMPENAVHIDVDEIKGFLDEYQEMKKGGDRYAAFGVHEESSWIGKRLQKEAQARKLNIVVDGTGDSPLQDGTSKFVGKIRDMHEAGYTNSVFYVNADTDVAVVRATGRALGSGRWVPEPTIREVHENVSKNFPHILGLAQSGMITDLRMFDTNGREPIQMVGVEDGEPVIHDRATYERFLAKGGLRVEDARMRSIRKSLGVEGEGGTSA